MKNPFIAMALMAAAMKAAFEENMAREIGFSVPSGQTKHRIAGKAQPAGAKLARMAKEKRLTFRHAKGLV